MTNTAEKAVLAVKVGGIWLAAVCALLAVGNPPVQAALQASGSVVAGLVLAELVWWCRCRQAAREIDAEKEQ